MTGRCLWTTFLRMKHSPFSDSFWMSALSACFIFPTVHISRPLLIEEIPQTDADVRTARPEDFALYDQVMAAGGRLRCR